MCTLVAGHGSAIGRHVSGISLGSVSMLHADVVPSDDGTCSEMVAHKNGPSLS
jgi:hypothetical protein